VDNQEAKFILNAYRPGGQDADDPRFAEALAHARRDPTLERWFREAVAFDAAVAEKFRTVAVPPDLREKILVGVKVSRPLRWSKPFMSWAVAAALMVVAALGSWIWHSTRPARLAGWQSHALVLVSSIERHELKFDAQSHDAGELVSWLQANDAPAAQKLPQSLEKLESLGCKTFLWNQELASVICFRRPEGGLIHLVVRRASAASDRTIKGEPELVQQGEWATATWRKGDMIYMLALKGPRDRVRTYLL
jgi:hypothetical protein